MNKLIKTVIAIMLCAAVPVCSLVSAGAAGSYFLEDGFYYGVQDSQAYVHGCEGDETDIVIRELFLGKYYVTSVESSAFYENTTMRTLSFYDATALRELGSGAFGRCTALEYVNIPAQIKTMGAGVFDSCTALSYVRFHKGAAGDIPAQSFYGCTALETVVFLNEPTSIGSLAFANCTALRELELPDSVVSIADNAFDGCDNLIIRCHADSYAMQYAIEHHIRYKLTGEVTVVIGDADANGSVNILDATRIQRVLVAFDAENAEDARLRGDCDGDGLNILDATMIQRWLASYTVSAPVGESRTVVI